ncbi:MAG TPA: hypothetical protein VJQ47_03815 [Steroidobacteraceae bacterium]|nr:hypothetical protein [Steroidobacteraceae bacterium]
MSEVLIVLSDAYFRQSVPDVLTTPRALAGLEQVTRFGSRSRLARGWRPEVMQWTGRPDLADEAPATVAAAAFTAIAAGAPSSPIPRACWIATPVHLIASLTSVHLDRRGLLRLRESDAVTLVEDFRTAFEGSDFQMFAHRGELLLVGPPLTARTLEPSRALGMSLEEAVPEGSDAARLRRLIAEMEMWLHGHALNTTREQRRELHISSLWPWGGGSLGGCAPRAMDEAGRDQSRTTLDARARVAVFGPDAYLHGVAAVSEASLHDLPREIAPVLGYSSAARLCVRIEIGSMLQTHPGWTVLEAFTQIDERFIAPAVRALQAGSVSRLDLLANDVRFSVRGVDRLKRWRRVRPGLSGLLS